MTKTKAIRLSETEERLIDEFLKKNPFFDFSSLARTSILRFIENPQLNLTPVRSGKKNSKEVTHGQ
jgi:hypothetical protein